MGRSAGLTPPAASVGSLRLAPSVARTCRASNLVVTASASDCMTSDDTAPTAARFSWAHAPGLACLLFLVLGVPLSRFGLWEPGEAGLLRAIVGGEGAWLAPVLDGTTLYRPWLQWIGMRAGLALSGEATGIRLFGMLALVIGLVALWRALTSAVGISRATWATAAAAATPLVFLAAHHANHLAFPVATLTLAFALVFVGLRQNTVSPLIGTMLGGSAALTLWGGGALALGTLLYSLAIVALATRNERPREGLVGGRSLAALGTLVCVALVAVVALRGGALWLESLAVIALTVLPATLLLWSLPGSALSGLLQGRGGWATAMTFCLTAGGGLLVALSDLGAAHTLRSLLFFTPLQESALPAQVPFDVTLRVAAFSAYPLVAFAPLAFAWALQRRGEATATRSALLLLVAWSAVSFLIYGWGASFVRVPVSPLAVPVVVLTALALTDGAWWRRLRAEPALSGTLGLTCLFLFVMMTRDVKGYHNMDVGRPGPHVVLETLLLDGASTFPKTFVFPWMTGFLLFWALAFVALFLSPLRQLEGLASTMRGADSTQGGRLGRWARRATAALGGLALRLAISPAQAVRDTLLRLMPPQGWAAALFLGSALAWGAVLSIRDLPRATPYFSQSVVWSTFVTFAGPDAPLHTTGLPHRERGYYLGSERVVETESMAALAELFCAEDRRFAVLRGKDLPAFHQAVRRLAAQERDCGPDARPYLLDASATRYALVSNRLPDTPGFVERNPIADNLFVEADIPGDATRPEERIEADGRLRLVASRITPSTVSRGEVMVEVWWEVLRPLTGDWEVFIHADTRGNRINGDHAPVGGAFPLRFWSVGEIVRDAYPLPISRTARAGVYTVHYGFFRGERRMTITPAREDNRVEVGRFGVRTPLP